MSTKGYTILEIVVATGIFAVLIVIFVGIFSRFVSIQDRGTSTQAIQEELRAAIEIMNREIRTGYGSTYDLSDSAGRGVTFRNQNGVCVHYNWHESRIERAEAEAFGSNCSPSLFTPSAYTSLTSSAVTITRTRFDIVRSEQNGDELVNQGVITLMLEAASTGDDAVPIRLQSTVTSRQVIPFPGI